MGGNPMETGLSWQPMHTKPQFRKMASGAPVQSAFIPDADPALVRAPAFLVMPNLEG